MDSLLTVLHVVSRLRPSGGGVAAAEGQPGPDTKCSSQLGPKHISMPVAGHHVQPCRPGHQHVRTILLLTLLRLCYVSRPLLVKGLAGMAEVRVRGIAWAFSRHAMAVYGANHGVSSNMPNAVPSGCHTAFVLPSNPGQAT